VTTGLVDVDPVPPFVVVVLPVGFVVLVGLAVVVVVVVPVLTSMVFA